MKKLFITLAILFTVGTAALAQPRAVGGRISANFWLPEASYQHYLGPGFLQGDLQFAWGPVVRYDEDAARRVHTGVAFLLNTSYNYIFLKPNWTVGSWDIYAGGGLAIGRMYDKGSYTYDRMAGSRIAHRQGLGFTMGVSLTAGLSYTFAKVPIQLAAEIHPVFGVHMCEDYYPYDFTRRRLDGSLVAPTVVGFYRNGLWGFLPSIAVRYAF